VRCDKSVDDVSRTSNTHSSFSTYRAFDRRTVVEIQNEILKQGGRHRFTRFLHARNDKDTIADWKSDLNRILAIFNVRSVSLLGHC